MGVSEQLSSELSCSVLLALQLACLNLILHSPLSSNSTQFVRVIWQGPGGVMFNKYSTVLKRFSMSYALYIVLFNRERDKFTGFTT
jgi:hypothetical protein